MSPCPALARLWLAGALMLVACGLSEVFRPSRVADVEFAFTGDTVLDRGEQAPFSVTVTAGGSAVAAPRLVYAVSDTALLQLTADSAAVIGVLQGNATLTVRWLGSIFTDTLPTFIQPIRVKGGPPP